MVEASEKMIWTKVVPSPITSQRLVTSPPMLIQNAGKKGEGGPELQTPRVLERSPDHGEPQEVLGGPQISEVVGGRGSAQSAHATT